MLPPVKGSKEVVDGHAAVAELVRHPEFAAETPEGRLLAVLGPPGEPEVEAERRSTDRGVVMDPEHHASLVDLGSSARVPFPATTPIGG